MVFGGRFQPKLLYDSKLNRFIYQLRFSVVPWIHNLYHTCGLELSEQAQLLDHI